MFLVKRIRSLYFYYANKRNNIFCFIDNAGAYVWLKQNFNYTRQFDMFNLSRVSDTTRTGVDTQVRKKQIIFKRQRYVNNNTFLLITEGGRLRDEK